MRLSSFWLKVILAAGLVVLADCALFETPGAGLGTALLQIALVVAVALTNPATLRNRLGLIALGVATLFAAVQIDRPSVLAVGFVLAGVGVAVLSPTAPSGKDAWNWALRLLSATWGLVGPISDALKLNRVLRVRSRIRVSGVLVAAVLPVVGGAVFLALFAAANPLVAKLFGDIAFLKPDPARMIFVLVMAAAAWTALRPRRLRIKAKAGVAEGGPPVGVGAITASLIVFNLIFALQNGLDLAFLWSGAALPEGMSHAEYAHRGAYPLIATALLAGLFVLIFLRPGWPSGQSKAVRGLVILWIAQNVFLVGSTMLRTAAYVEAYSLTRMRIAALLWMGLVAIGLVLICWRQVRGKSGGWLVNANALAAGAVLAVCAVVDLGPIAASWNIRHAREVDGSGQGLDAGYIGQLRGGGFVALGNIENRALPSGLCAHVHTLRRWNRQRLQIQQADWRSWRWRDARRLEADAQLGGDCRTLPLTPIAKP